MNTPIDAVLIFRLVSFTAASFEYLKTLQADLQQRIGKRLTNSETLAVIIQQHREMSQKGVMA